MFFFGGGCIASGISQQVGQNSGGNDNGDSPTDITLIVVAAIGSLVLIAIIVVAAIIFRRKQRQEMLRKSIRLEAEVQRLSQYLPPQAIQKVKEHEHEPTVSETQPEIVGYDPYPTDIVSSPESVALH